VNGRDKHSRNVARRCFDSSEAALITVERPPRKTPIVTLVGL
jgi:hypothetical protein